MMKQIQTNQLNLSINYKFNENNRLNDLNLVTITAQKKFSIKDFLLQQL